MEAKLKTEYKDLQEIGKGTISRVLKGVHRNNNNKVCAIKHLKGETIEFYDIFLNEITIQRELSHPNVMPIYSHDSNKETREAYYIMPYLRSLRNLINTRTQRPEIKDVIRLIRDTTSALDHAKKYQTNAHNNLKPENIFFSEETQSYLLADWSGHLTFRKNNSLRNKKPGASKKRVPSSIYEAPEAMMSLEALSRDKISSYKADVYSLGIVILEFCGVQQEKLGELNCALIDEDFKFMQSKIQEEVSSWFPHEKIVNTLLKMSSRWAHDRPSAYELIWQTENISYSLLDSEKSEATLGDDSDRKSDKNESNSGEKNRNTQRSKPSIFLKKQKSGIDFRGNFDIMQAKPSMHRKNTEEFNNQREAMTDSRIKKSKIFEDESISFEQLSAANNLKEMTDRISKTEESVYSKSELSYAGLLSPDKKSKSDEMTLMTQEVQPKLKSQDTPDSPEESKESDDGIFIVKNSLSGPRSRANSRFVLMSKEELIKTRQKHQQKQQKQQMQQKQQKSGFSNFLGSFGEGITDFGKKALDRIENLNFFNFKKEPKKASPELTSDSTNTEKILSPKEQMLMTSQLKLPNFSFLHDPRTSLFSPGDHGEIDFEPDELLEIEPKSKSNPKQRYSEAKPIEKLIQKAYVFSGPIVSTSWSPNGKHIVTGSLDHSVRIMDTETNECVEDVGYVHRDPVLCVAWSPDGSNIASGSDDGSLKVFNFQMNKLHHSFDELYVGSVSSVVWSPDGTQIASASLTAIKIVDYYNKKLVHTFKNLHTDDINEIAWAKNGRYLASASADKTVKIIDVDSKCVYHTFEVFEGEAKAIAWSRASTSVAVGSSDQSLKVLDIVKREVACSFDEALGAVTSVSWSNDGKYIASGSEDCLVRIYEFAKKLLTIIIEQHKSHILTLNWAPDSENLISSSKDCKLILYNIRKKLITYTWSGGFDNTVTALGWSKNKQYVAAGSAKGALRVYNMEDMSIIATIDKAHQAAIKCISWSYDGKFIATGSQDCSLMLYSPQDKKTIWTISQLHQADINTVDWSLNAKLLLTGSNDSSVKIIDVQTKAVLFNLSEIHTDSIRSVAWSRDNKRFVSCANDWSVNISRIDTLKTECLYSDIYWPSFVGWSHDERSILSGSEGGAIKVFDLKELNFKNEMTTRSDSVDVIYGYSHAAEAGLIAAISIDPSIKIYNCNTQELLFELEGHDQDRVCTVALSQDGKRMITGLQDGSMRVYNLTF